MERVLLNPVTLTKEAADEIKKLMSVPDFDPELKLRVGVKGGGCSGFAYLIGFDEKTDGDNEFEWEGISYIIKKEHQFYLLGTEIGWQNNADNRGFTFSNANK